MDEGLYYERQANLCAAGDASSNIPKKFEGMFFQNPVLEPAHSALYHAIELAQARKLLWITSSSLGEPC